MDFRKDKKIPDEDNDKLKTDNLSEEELEARAVKKNEADTLKAEEEAKEKAADEEARGKLETENEKVDWDMGKEVGSTKKKCMSNLAIKRLSKKEQKELFKCVRYSFLTHEDLINLTSNPVFSTVAKDYIIEGMSARLN